MGCIGGNSQANLPFDTATVSHVHVAAHCSSTEALLTKCVHVRVLFAKIAYSCAESSIGLWQLSILGGQGVQHALETCGGAYREP